MSNKLLLKVIVVTCILLLLSPIIKLNQTSAETNKTVIYDYANLLTVEEVDELTSLSHRLSKKRETDFLILTTKDTGGRDVVKYMEDFYDEVGPGYDKQHGNTVILTIDMENREVYVAGFYKGKTYLDNDRADLVRSKITPQLSAGNYFSASKEFINTAYKYMGIKPGIDPENIIFKWSFQIATSLLVALIVIMVMVFRIGGRVTVSGSTYIDNKSSRMISKKDQYLRTTVTKVKKPSNNNNSSGGSGFGGGGGGFTGGGHSHSGSRGSF